MTDLLDIGSTIRDAYATSIGEGHKAWMGYAAKGMTVYHVPELPGDGTPLGDLDQLAAGADAETSALEKISCKITVEAVRQTGDDLLILECVFTGVLPSGDAFSYPNVLLFTFRDDKIARLVEVASADMWSTLSKALRDAAGYTGAAS